LKRSVLWLAISALVVLALVLASCRPAAVEEEGERIVGKVVEKEEKVTEKEKEVVPEVKGPQYGGILSVTEYTEAPGYDPWWYHGAGYADFVCEQLNYGDITLTEEQWAFTGNYSPSSIRAGCLAESWEAPDISTAVFHLRKGIHWQNIPPVNGREFTADDVVYTVNRLMSPQSPAYATWKASQLKSVTALDKYTVEFKYDPPLNDMMEGFSFFIVPHEVVEEYGDLSNPRNFVGTGPFMVDDYVQGNSWTFKRNPTYWGKDPLNPENRLPYVDGVQVLIIGDEATRLAALRSGKVDMLDRRPYVPALKAETLIRTNPELKYRQFAFERAVFFVINNANEPLDDVRVRQALSMAIDRKAIVEDYYKGRGYCGTYPFAPGWKDYYVPIEQRPENIRKLYEYRPEEAKKLLAEAGYPNGFKTEFIAETTQPEFTNIALLCKEWWKDIGVDVEIKMMEYPQLITQMVSHAYKGMVFCFAGYSFPARSLSFWYVPEGTTGCTPSNWPCVNDPVHNANWEAIRDCFDKAERVELIKKAAEYAQEQVWNIDMCSHYFYVFWWPWVKGPYWGQTQLYYMSSGSMYKYLWLDSQLKKSMGF
jgi:peptide/nickel transport system substrate-binding protein